MWSLSAGYVLVGGRSSRMGEDKALLPWPPPDIQSISQSASEPLAVHVARRVLEAAGSVTLVGDPNRYSGLGFPVVPDLHPGLGPLAGVEAALRHSNAEWNLIVACDLPNLEASFLTALLDRKATVVAVSQDGQPALCAVLHRDCLGAVEAAIAANRLSWNALMDEIHAIRQTAPYSEILANINTPKDLPNVAEPESHYIEFRQVNKTFDRPVLVDVSFHVDAGETLGIIGRSGVGKSVTLQHIMGFLKPDSGSIFVAYTDITGATETELRRIRKKVTMVFQSGALFDSMTVGENILFSLELREDYDAKNKNDVVNGLLHMVDLADYRDSYPADLSTGHKRAVAIARALAAQPECILYDEPTTMVDAIMSDHVSNLMLRLKHQLKLTSVVVTHDLDLMRKVADNVVVLHEGHAIYFGPVSELEQSQHPHIQEFLAMDRVEID